MRTLLFIGSGGFIGAVLRYVLSSRVQSLAGATSLPVGTFFVNGVGCFAIGVLAAVVDTRVALDDDVRKLLGVGILGGFTTFSAFGFEAFELLRRGSVLLAAVHVVGQVTVGVTAVALGYLLFRTS